MITFWTDSRENHPKPEKLLFEFENKTFCKEELFHFIAKKCNFQKIQFNKIFVKI